MSTGGNKGRVSIGKKAIKGILQHFSEVTGVVFIQLAVRLAVFSPLILSEDFGGKMPSLISWLFVGALYIVLVIPARFWGREKLRRLFFTRHQASRGLIPYSKWLKAGLWRYARGILWGLPFLAGMVYLTVFRQILDYKTFEAPVHWLATLLGGDVSLALGIIFGLMAAFGLLFAYGWGRDMPVEYLPCRSMTTEQIFHWSRHIRKNHGAALWKNAMANCLLLLPGLIGFGAVLVQYLSSRVDFSLSPDMIFNLLLRILREPLPRIQQLLLLGVFFVLYLPFCVLRKTRCAALVARCMKEHQHHHHSSHKHESGSGQDSDED